MKKITYDQILEAENDLRHLKDQYLRKAGWKYTCSNPASVWLWQKEIEEKTYYVSQAAAILMQRHLDDWELEK